MREALRSPCEYYIRYLITVQQAELPEIDPPETEEGEEEQEPPSKFVPEDIIRHLEGLQLDGMNHSYIRQLIESMQPFPDPFFPQGSDLKTRKYLREHKIYDMWNPTQAVQEAKLILVDAYLREKLEPLLLSPMTHTNIARRLRKYTSVALTRDGVGAYGHFFWNRKLLSQGEWLRYLDGRPNRNIYSQSLLTSPDVALQHLPWVVGISGPSQSFNSAEAAARIGQIALKQALELEHKPASFETTNSLRNCMVTIEKADQVMRKSDVALRDVLKQFQKFRMKVDEAKVIDINQLTSGNYSKSGEGTDVEDDDF